MKYFIENCGENEVKLYLRSRLILGYRADSLEKFSISGMFDTPKTGYYGSLSEAGMWIVHYDSERLFRLGRPMHFYFSIVENAGGCEIIGKWRFPRWYRKSLYICFLLPLLWGVSGFEYKTLSLMYVFLAVAFGIFYTLSRISVPEDKITELINDIPKSEIINISH